MVTGAFCGPAMVRTAVSCGGSSSAAKGRRRAAETPIGLVPGSLDTSGLDIDLVKLLEVDHDQWRAETNGIEEHFATFGDRLPNVLRAELDDLRRRLT